MTKTDQRIFRLGFAPRASGGVMGPLAWIAGLIVGAAALAVGAVLAVFATIAVTIIAVVGSVLVFFAGLALRMGRRRAAVAPSPDGVIDARKVGDTWVAYGWERRGR